MLATAAPAATLVLMKSRLEIDMMTLTSAPSKKGVDQLAEW
jgi:hypothetical protein